MRRFHVEVYCAAASGGVAVPPETGILVHLWQRRVTGRVKVRLKECTAGASDAVGKDCAEGEVTDV